MYSSTDRAQLIKPRPKQPVSHCIPHHNVGNTIMRLDTTFNLGQKHYAKKKSKGGIYGYKYNHPMYPLYFSFPHLYISSLP